MPRVERLFSSQPLTGAPGVFDSGGPGFAEGAAEATRQIRGASRRAFASQKAALDRQTSALAQRAEAVRVLGATVSGAGRDLVDIGVELNRREDQARREDAFATARTNLLIADDDAKRVARQTGRPDGGDYESVYLDSLENALPKILEGAVGDTELGRGIETMIDEIRTRGRIDMRAQAAKAKGAHRLAKLEGRIADVANKAIGLKGLEQQIILQAGFDDIDAQHVVGTIDLGQRNTKMAALRAFVRDGTIAVDAGRDPAAAGQRLQAGGYDHLFVNEAEKVAAGRTIKAELAAQRAAAEARLDDDIDDHLERIETTGRGTPGMKARVKVLDGDIARFADLEAQAELYFRTAQQIRWATPEDAEAAVAE